MGNISIYGVLNAFYPACLLSIIQVPELTTGLVDQLVLVDRLYVENWGKLSDVTGVVTVTVGTAQGVNRTIEIVVGIK